MSIFRSSDGRKFQSEIHMVQHQQALNHVAELESTALGLSLAKTATRAMTQARELHRSGAGKLELADGSELSWFFGKTAPRGSIQHNPLRVEELRWMLAKRPPSIAANRLWRRLHNIDNYGKEWDGKPGSTICYEDRS